MTRRLPSLLFDLLDGVGPGQAEYAPPKVKYDVPKAIIEAIYLCLFLGLFIDQVVVPMHLGHQPIVPGVPHCIVDVESLGV